MMLREPTRNMQKMYTDFCLVWLCQIAKHIWYQWLEKHSRFKQVELTDDMPGYE